MAALPRRDRIALLSALAGTVVLCWAYLVAFAVEMHGSMSMGDMLEMRAWSAIDFALMLWMWVVMMVGMMLPSAAPMILVFAAVARKAARQGSVLAPTAVFAAGYVAIWTAFSVAATFVQWWLDQFAMLSPMMVTTSPLLGGLILVGAGLYQLTPWKDACLRHCRAPAHFISGHWRAGRAGAFRMGAIHGAYCLGCCWLLMALLLFGGVMSLLWIAGITLFVLLEKLLPWGARGGQLAGFALVALGVAVVIGGR